MTEAEWLACNDRDEMLRWLRERGSDRKFSLFAVAACYLCPWNAIPDSKYEIVVRYVDGVVGVEQLRLIWKLEPAWPERAYDWASALALGWEREGDLPPVAELVIRLRDIFGNPFRPVVFDPEWRTSTAVALAKQMYESRDFSTMPILADALQDAGCVDEDILTHCRGDGPHVRGCWLVDLVLGKE